MPTSQLPATNITITVYDAADPEWYTPPAGDRPAECKEKVIRRTEATSGSVVTLVPKTSGQKINGANSLAVPGNGTIRLTTDGTNIFTI